MFDAADRLVEERWQPSATADISHTIQRIYDAADQLLGVTETDTTNPAATTAWQFAYDALGNVVKSRMAPGEIAQQPISWSGSLAASDSLIDWDGDGKTERYDLYSYSVAAGDVIDVTVTASAGTFAPALLLQRSSSPTELVWYEASAGASQLVTSHTAATSETWSFAVTARDENATGPYDIRIVKNGNAIVPTALVEYDYAYDKAGNLVSATEDQAAVAQFDTLGPAATGLGVQTSYTVNALNRVTRYRHIAAGQVTKRVDYAYRPDGSVGTVTRFAGAGINPIGTSTAAYDALGRLTGITHAPTASPAISYGYAYDAASRIQTMTTPEGTSTFTLDATDQLLSASLTGEAYAYDNTGNRTSGGTQTSTGNRLTFDGTYRYAYDAEGNRTAKFLDTNAGGTLSLGDTDVTVYAYDQRNRLVAVSHVNAWTSTQAVGLAAFTAQGTPLPGSDLELRSTYDYADRRIRRAIDADGQAGAAQENVSFAAYAGDVRTLEIARPNDKLVIDTATGRVIGFLGQVVQRNFYGNGVDEILAVDQIAWNTGTPTTSTFWTFTDHQDSVRDIVSGNAADRGAVVEHRQYDSFGRIVRRTNGPQTGAPATAGVGIDFGYAGRPLEARTGLSDNRARWYEPATGRFINEDPSGFRGGDANLFRYVGNDPLNKVDPSGLAAKWASYAGKANVPAGGWGALVQQNAALPKATSPSVSAMAYASPVRQPPQAPVGPIFSSMPAMTATVSGTRPIVTPVSQSVSGQAYSGLSAGGEPTFAQGFATSLGRNAVGIATGAAVGLGIAAAVPAAVLASPIVVGVGVTAAVFGAAYGGYRTGLAAYQAWTRNEVDPWTGAATGRTLTRAEQGAATGDFVAGGLTIGAGAAKAVASRFSAAPSNTALPESYWINKKAPTQIAPGTRTVTIEKPSSKGGTYSSTTHYDEYGRQVGQTHRTHHGYSDPTSAQFHPNPHHHRRDPITGEQLRDPSTGSRTWPGEF